MRRSGLTIKVCMIWNLNSDERCFNSHIGYRLAYYICMTVMIRSPCTLLKRSYSKIMQ